MRGILFLLLMTSCSHSLKLNPKGCFSSGTISELEANMNKVEITVTSYGSEDEKSLPDLLKGHSIDCKKLRNINYTFKQNTLDSLVSVIPFVSRKTIVINYSLE